MTRYGNGNKIIQFYGNGNNCLKPDRKKYMYFTAMVKIKPKISVTVANSYYRATL